MRKSPCKLDHNGECLICDCWITECAWDRFQNRDYKWETKEELELMFKDYKKMTYPEFIVQEYLNDTYRVSLNQPKLEDGSRPNIRKLGPFVYVNVQVEVVDIYSKSAKLRLTFEGIHREDIFYMSSHKSPDQLGNEIWKKIDKIVNRALIIEGKEEWIRAEFVKAQEKLNATLQKLVGEIKKIDGNKENNLQD